MDFREHCPLSTVQSHNLQTNLCSSLFALFSTLHSVPKCKFCPTTKVYFLPNAGICRKIVKNCRLRDTPSPPALPFPPRVEKASHKMKTKQNTLRFACLLGLPGGKSGVDDVVHAQVGHVSECHPGLFVTHQQHVAIMSTAGPCPPTPLRKDGGREPMDKEV